MFVQLFPTFDFDETHHLSVHCRSAASCTHEAYMQQGSCQQSFRHVEGVCPVDSYDIGFVVKL